MPEEPNQTEVEEKKNGDEIANAESTRTGARGNVHSEEDENVPDFEAPPPHPL